MMVLNMDCLAGMRLFPDNSFDAIVTDPPYELGFMGRAWDSTGIANNVEVWREVLRVLKPGGHMLAFSGSRTYHRMTCAIEDAGFEIRDCIYWHYGSGFPKSKNLDGDWKGWGTALKPSTEPLAFARKPLPEQTERDIIDTNLLILECQLWLLAYFANAAGSPSPSNPAEPNDRLSIAQWTVGDATSTSAVLSDQMGTSLFESALITCLSIVSSWRHTLVGFCKPGNTSTIETKFDTTIDWKILSYCLSAITPRTIIPALTNQNGSAAFASPAEAYFNAELKRLSAILELSAAVPVMSQDRINSLAVGAPIKTEHIAMARKPLAKGRTVAANVLQFGTGALNIDGCRVGDAGGCKTLGGDTRSESQEGAIGAYSSSPLVEGLGRWPANLIHDGSDEVLAAFPDAKGQQGATAARSQGDVYGAVNAGQIGVEPRNDAGSAARFFYCAKSSRADRNEGLADPGPQFQHGATLRKIEDAPKAGNTHPTVKPNALMRYLCRLVTPPGGRILDPFAGSGSTGKAAKQEGFGFVGFELEEAYANIANARIEAAQRETQ